MVVVVWVESEEGDEEEYFINPTWAKYTFLFNILNTEVYDENSRSNKEEQCIKLHLKNYKFQYYRRLS